jgi:hypothetical protein
MDGTRTEALGAWLGWEPVHPNAMEKRAFDATDWAAVNRDISYGA